ncbi:MAG: ABC transporter substrate-binding protein [Alphaproteobacteria bacterium]|nr:ABC transporter substrate-binding protein [Alphaproteobacteria bacterium]
MTMKAIASAVALLGLVALAAPTAAQTTRISFGQAAPPSLAGAQVHVAQQLGYFREEGLEVEQRVFAGGVNSVNQTVNRQADVSFPGNEPVIIGKQPGRDALPVRFFYNATPTLIWELIVPEASPIRTLQDLRGRTIGIFAPSASNVPQVRAILRREGINPDTQVTFRNIGLGAGALNAMTTNAVQVIALYDTEHATFETMGTQIRRLPQSPAVAPLFSNGLLTHEDNLRDPARRRMLVGVGRAIARATLFCETNPRACVTLTWRQFPETKPTGVDDARALRDALFVLNSRLTNFRLRDYQNGQYGLYEPARWQAYVDFMLAEQQIERPVDINTIFTNDLIAEINQFDRDAVRRQAQAAQ